MQSRYSPPTLRRLTTTTWLRSRSWVRCARPLWRTHTNRRRGRSRYDVGKLQLDELAWAWSGFLTDAQRVFLKLREATRAGPSNRWSEILQRTRDQDELLRYVHQARHADEHGLESAQKQNGELNITAGDGPAHIHTITAIPGKGVSIEYRGERPVVTWTPERVVLLPVRNRGVVYPVPTQHLRQRLPDATAMSIAER